jgi:hypothetical protein
MRTTIDLPEAVYRKGENAARMQGVTIEEFIVQALESVLIPDREGLQGRVALPLIRSKRPASLDLSTYDFDDLLA